MDSFTRRFPAGVPRRIRTVTDTLRRVDRQGAFKERGRDLNAYFMALELGIQPNALKLLKPEFTFHHVEWTDLHPPEHFSFSRCKVIYKDIEYEGWVYYPHPETKLRHFQNPSLLEVIAVLIPHIEYGDELDVLVNSEEILVMES